MGSARSEIIKGRALYTDLDFELADALSEDGGGVRPDALELFQSCCTDDELAKLLQIVDRPASASMATGD